MALFLQSAHRPARLNADGTTTDSVKRSAVLVGGAAPGAGACAAGSAFKSTVLESREFFLGNSIKPRLAIGVGFNWNSPFGPFRFDFAKALMKQPGDDPKTFTFNVGTQF